jgi:hypothetical protein
VAEYSEWWFWSEMCRQKIAELYRAHLTWYAPFSGALGDGDIPTAVRKLGELNLLTTEVLYYAAYCLTWAPPAGQGQTDDQIFLAWWRSIMASFGRTRQG